MTITKAKPILASAAVALSLAACQWMGGGEAGQQTSSAPYPSASQASDQQSSGGGSAQAQQAVSPDLIRNVQRTLSQRGYDAGPVDGIYGESTQQALSNFQRDQRLDSSGQLDSQTLAALGVVAEGSRAATGPARQDYRSTARRGAMMDDDQRRQSSGRQQASRQQERAPGNLSYEQVRNLQQELSSRGYDPGEVDGMWGRNTQQALRQFQQDQDLPASGRPDQRTMAALGVEDAGVQTGEMPAERPRSPQPGGTQEDEMRRQEGMEPEGFREREETGQLPDTGSEAPGSAQPSERMGGTEGVEPDTPEESAPGVPPSPEPGETR